MKDFYIGYVPRPPERIARLMRIVAGTLLLAAAGSAITISVSQNPFAASVFEYGHPRMFEGVLEASPYPTLAVRRPGKADSGSSRYLLVGEGKHGADPLVAPFDGKTVRMKGALIYRDGGAMIEVMYGSIEPIGAERPAEATTANLGRFELIGEIVDSKCYFGVMNPGNGKVHHDCAVRCLSGGIPPGFAVPDFQGGKATFLLTDREGKALPRSAYRSLVARPVRISGNASRLGDALYLAVEPSGITCAVRSPNP